ncbi:MAG: S1 family peptidase [Alphaproteobacteria bacterium]
MPRIPENHLDCVCYLYRTRADAKVGRNTVGTGFLTIIQSQANPAKGWVYAITNWHVACRDGGSVVSINTHEGEPDVFEFDSAEWQFDARFDIAAIPIPLDNAKHRIAYVPTPGFLEASNPRKIGVGEDVYMLGRFIDYTGAQVASPFVRFGHISSMPVPIKQPNGIIADSFCIDVHSRSGYSGSPVWVYRTPGYNLAEVLDAKSQKVLLAGTSYLGLLGIHWGQFPELWELESIKGGEEPKREAALITEGNYVRGLSGMTCVLPAWNILEVLNLPKLKNVRDRDEKILAAKKATAGEPIAESTVQADNPEHQEDFKRLLNAAAKPQKRAG